MILCDLNGMSTVVQWWASVVLVSQLTGRMTRHRRRRGEQRSARWSPLSHARRRLARAKCNGRQRSRHGRCVESLRRVGKAWRRRWRWKSMICWPCSEVYAGWRWATVSRSVSGVTVMKAWRGVRGREWPPSAWHSDEVGRRVVVSPATFVKLVRCLIFRKPVGI